MQIRCSYCQTMFPISREETLAALETMAEENLKYYDAHCPNCRRANRVERFKLEASYPGWQNDLNVMAKQAEKDEKAAALPVKQEEELPVKTEAKSKTSLAKEPVKKKTPAKQPAAPNKKPAGKGTSQGKKK